MAFPIDPAGIPTFNAGHLPARLEFVAYPLDSDRKRIPPAELEDFCYSHYFYLPLCFHDKSTKIEIQEVGDGAPAVYIRCARAMGERCSYNVNVVTLLSSPNLVCAPYRERSNFAEDDDSMRSFIVSDSDMDDYSDSMSIGSDSEWSSTSTKGSSDADSEISALELSEGSSLDSVLIFDSNMEPRGCPGSPTLGIVNRRILYNITNQEIRAADTPTIELTHDAAEDQENIAPNGSGNAHSHL
ncbi:hypothetical protein BKA70DRAFT_1438833 [Coprinopsis sp. MPI-PUGE-AT-0042]|nr:hypothetical protein BKA70DRAFT_1438833 [Coprinopsis sp. MPI-PUGE-AT-0042]